VRLALTATATKRVAADILDKLEISPSNVVRLPSVRRNLALAVRAFSHPHDGYEERLAALLESIAGLTGGGAAIVYVSRQKLAEKLAADLVNRGNLNARAYHAGMESEAREEVEYWFLSRKKSYVSAPIVVGTVAFGMGIDKVRWSRSRYTCIRRPFLTPPPAPSLSLFSLSVCVQSDIRSVVHFDLPRSVEEYVQGCGRAGRDFHAASCLAFLAASDAPGLRRYSPISLSLSPPPSLSQCKGVGRDPNPPRPTPPASAARSSGPRRRWTYCGASRSGSSGQARAWRRPTRSCTCRCTTWRTSST